MILNSRFRFDLRRWSMVLGMVLIVVGAATASEYPPSRFFGENVFAEVTGCESCPQIRVLVREFPEDSAIQSDVAIGDDVVSFVNVKGVGQRAWCELVYIDESSWFGICDVYDVSFDSYQTLVQSWLSCEDCKVLTKHEFRGHDDGCGPHFVAHGTGPGVELPAGNQWRLELSNWEFEKLAVLQHALEMTGLNVCPRLGKNLVKLFGLSPFGSLPAGLLERVDGIPPAIAPLMDSDQHNGLLGLLEREVERMPFEPPSIAPAGSELEVVSVSTRRWWGLLESENENLIVDVTIVTADDLSLMVGSVKNEDGENMAFLVPTSGKGLITSTWAITSLNESQPSTLWSDGTCQLLEVRTTREPEEFYRRAPWLGWGIRAPDIALLSFLQHEDSVGWAVEQIYLGLREFHQGCEIEVEDLGDVVRDSSNNPTIQPEMLLEYWDEIAFRYFDTRDRMRRVGELQSVGSAR